MQYSYHCIKCGSDHDIDKPIDLATREEICPSCEITMERVYKPVQLMKTGVQSAEYNPAFGCVVNNAQHRAELAKQRGMIEVGNESVDNIVKHSESSKPNRSYEE